jgi:hypothetical protein
MHDDGFDPRPMYKQIVKRYRELGWKDAPQSVTVVHER